MKRFLLLGFAIIIGSVTFGQNIIIQRIGGNHPLNDSTITVYGTTATSLLTQPLEVINTGLATLKIKVKRVEDIVVPHTRNYLCWGLCYGPDTNYVWTAPSVVSINVNDTNKTFTGDYTDSSRAGIEEITYIFYNSAAPTDSSWINIIFNITPAGIAQISESELHVSAPYPNPAGSMVSFNYHLIGAPQAKLEVFNTIGQCVQTLPVNASSNKLNVNVSGLPSGIYICKFEAEGAQAVFQKLIVTH